MKYVVGLCAVILFAAAPVAASKAEPVAKKRPAPGTVYRVQRELGRVQVMDHQERIFVVSAQDLQHRSRTGSGAGRSLRTGDRVWFRTVAGS